MLNENLPARLLFCDDGHETWSQRFGIQSCHCGGALYAATRSLVTGEWHHRHVGAPEETRLPTFQYQTSIEYSR